MFNPLEWVDPLGLSRGCVNNGRVYENPGHHDPSNAGPNQYNSSKSVLPKNHEELWDKSKLTSDGNHWAKEGVGKKAVYHRFQNDGNGNWHWNGSTNGITKHGQSRAIKMNHVPSEVKNGKSKQ